MEFKNEKSFSTEKIISILKEQEAGLSTSDILRKHGICKSTFHKWKSKYGGMESNDAAKLKSLEQENIKLKRLVADLSLDNIALKDVLSKKVVTPVLKREVVTYFMKQYKFSERKSCKLTGLGISSMRYTTQKDDDTNEIKLKLQSLARKHTRAGYRMLGARLVKAGYKINHKRVYRLYKELELKLPKKQGKKLKHESRNDQLQVSKINDCWSIDFVSDRLTDGRKLRFLNMIDNYSRISPGISVASSLPSSSVIEILTESINKYGKPNNLLLDNGPEFRSQEFQKWAQENDIVLQYITPGKPTQNAYIESFNGKFRAEFLDQHWFSTMVEVQRLTEKWRKYYNENRPHSSLDYLTPNEFIQIQERNMH